MLRLPSIELTRMDSADNGERGCTEKKGGRWKR
jgi:hypothetical protein